jgi:C-terminal processing protease CtpA/Prc
MAWMVSGANALAQEVEADVESEAAADDSTEAAETNEPQDIPPPRPEPESQIDDAATPGEESDDRAREERRSVLVDQDDSDDTDEDSDDAEMDAESRFERSDRRRDNRQRDFGIRFGVSRDRGLEIDTLQRNGLFYRSGLRQGDVLISIHGKPVRSEAEFDRFISRYPGQRIPLVVLRDGEEETIYVVYDSQDRDDRRSADDRSTSGSPYLGVTFEPGTRGVVMVGSVAPGSPAEESGLQTGDILLSLNDREVASPYDVIETVASMEPGEPLEIEFSRRVANTTQAIVGERPVRQARFEPNTRRESYYVDPDDPVPRTSRDFDDGDERVRGLGERRIIRPGDQDNDGRAIDRDRRLLPRRRD